MDDRSAHFLTMLGDAFVAASLAGLSLTLRMCDGGLISGATSASLAHGDIPSGSDTGYASVLLVDGARVRLEDVVEFAVHAP